MLRAIRIAACAALPAAVLGCGGARPGDAWLFILDGDTVTVAEAAAHWDSLGQADRDAFSESADPGRDYVAAYSRMLLVRRELRLQGCEDSESFSIQRVAAARNAMARALGDSMLAGALASVTDADVEAFLEEYGTSVLITMSNRLDTVTTGPVPLPELPLRVSGAIRDLGQGETAGLPDGVTVMLDSVFPSDPGMLAGMAADSAGAASYARDRIGRLRASASIEDLLAGGGSGGSVAIRPDAVAGLARSFDGGPEPAPDDTVLACPAGVWTASRLAGEIEYHGASEPVRPSDSSWVHSFAQLVANRSCMATEFQSRYPAAAGAIEAEAYRTAVSNAAESLYRRNVLEGIEITPGMIDSAYAASPPVIDEKRVVQAVSIPQERLGEFRESVAAGTAREYAEGLEGIFVAGQTAMQGSPPLSRNEFPFGLGDSVFALSDTLAWTGPVPAGPDSAAPYASMRLVEIIPARTATREEAEPGLSASIRSAMIESRILAWLDGLSEAAGLVIDEELLESLPADPGAWRDL